MLINLFLVACVPANQALGSQVMAVVKGTPERGYFLFFRVEVKMESKTLPVVFRLFTLTCLFLS